MDEIIKELGTMFEVILFDSPPIVAVTDAVVLSKKVDGVVLIVKAGRTTTEMVAKAKRQLLDVVQAGRDAAAEAIQDNEIPRKYEGPVKKYFGDLEESGKKAP
jgi:hypothetical protein